ncbi:MAG: glycosyltransferase family 2 protein [Paracoccaceae bacterium]
MTRIESPAVTVIIAAHNVADYIADAITSLKIQSFGDFEALIIDDGSSDATLAVARTAVADDSRFEIIHQSNKGLSGARNVGLDRARGTFIAFLDGDDRFDPDFLAVLHDDLVQSGGDWVACGLAFCTPDDTRHVHSAIHGRPNPDSGPTAKSYPLLDWVETIRHFPSAWNKLYRRDFVGDTRFDEGTWYEDHAFFQRLATKTETLRHISRCLYLYRVDRAGQITRTDSDRVFEQFTVLEICAEIMRSSGKAGATQGLARLATRLCNERLDVITCPDRASRFYVEAAAFFARHRLRPDWSWDPYLSALRSLALSGAAPITIRHVFPGTEDPALASDTRPSSAQRAHLIAEGAKGDPLPADGLVLDLIRPTEINEDALIRCGELLLQSDCAAVVSPLHRQGKILQPPAGMAERVPTMLTSDTILSWSPEDVVFLVKVPFRIQIAETDPELGLVEQGVRIAQSGKCVMWVGDPIAPSQPVLGPSASKRRKGIAGISAALDCTALPKGWDRRLFLRAASAHIAMLQQDGNSLRRRRHLLGPVARLWWMGLMSGWIGTPGDVDTTTPRILRRIFRLPKIG